MSRLLQSDFGEIELSKDSCRTQSVAELRFAARARLGVYGVVSVVGTSLSQGRIAGFRAGWRGVLAMRQQNLASISTLLPIGPGPCFGNRVLDSLAHLLLGLGRVERVKGSRLGA